MAKGAEKCSPCILPRHVVHFGNLKMDANEGVQSFNFEVGQKLKSFKEFESQLKHYQDAKLIQMYRSSSWNCLVCKIDVHLYASIACDGCLEWNHLKCVGLKVHPKSPHWLCRQCYIPKESNLITSYVIPSL
jgi:hypothetical protein